MSIVTAPSNGNSITFTGANKSVLVKLLQLQRHRIIVSVTSHLLERHDKCVPVTSLPLLAINYSVAFVTFRNDFKFVRYKRSFKKYKYPIVT